MKKLLIIFILVSSAFGFCFAKSKNQKKSLETEKSVPKWITDQGRLTLFPDSDFISQLAYGNTAQDSKENASANISEYIKSSVESSTSSNYFYKKSSGKVIENREVKEDIKISTNNNLFKIEYTNPYYYEDLGQYVCVAFINKNQAFDFVKPKLDIGKNTFLQSYATALKKDSILESVIGIYNAHKNLYDFYEVYDFARAINPKKSEVYEQVDALAKESLLKLKELSSKVSVRIEGVGNKKLIDDSGIIVELSEQFEELDFVVVSSFDAIYVATVEIKSTIKKTAKTFESYPEMIIKILENGEEKISYSKKLSKVAGFDSETVSRRVNTALIKELKSSFLTEIF